MRRILLGLFILLPLIVSCHSPVFTIKPFEAWAVDAETGEPIEGAIVVATWALFKDAVHGGAKFQEMLEVKEAVTDKNGHFAFRGFQLKNPSMNKLMEDPKIIIFKPGYAYVRRTNGCGMGAEGDCRWATRIAVVAGQKVKMKKIDYTLSPKDARLRTSMNQDLYSGLSIEMSYVESSGRKKDIPLFYQAVEGEIARLKAEGYSDRNGLP